MLDTAPQDYNQPLTRAGHLWRAVLCLVISTLSWWSIAGDQWQHHRPLFWIDLTCGILSFGLVVFRRRWPFRIALVATVLGLISLSSAGPGALALVSLATRRRLPQILTVGAVAIVTGQLFNYYQPNPSNDPPWVSFTVLVLGTVALSVLGMYVGSRRELVWSLRERARAAEAQQELRAEQARSAEREKIAREMHDVLAHRISLVTMHAGALAYRTDLSAEQIHETAELIQTTAYQALADLRHVLGVLRASDQAGDRPQPTLGDLGTLLGEARDGGMVVDLTDHLAGHPPPDQVGRALYRIIQEALTNARKHAIGTRVAINLTGDAESGVTVTVRNPKRVGALGRPATLGSGLGLVGLRERAALAGGTLEVEDTAEEFRLYSWLPWLPGTAPGAGA